MVELLTRAVVALETIARELVRARAKTQLHRKGADPHELDPARCDSMHCLYCCGCDSCTADRALIRFGV